MVISHSVLVYKVYQKNVLKVCPVEFMNVYLDPMFCYTVIYVIIEHKLLFNCFGFSLQTLFSVNPCQHPIVILKDVKYNDLKTMVDFMYYGEVNVSHDQLPAILKV